MSVGYNPKIVTDGLVLCLDATNPKSFSPNVHPKPTDIYAWVNNTVGNNCTLSRDNIQSPVGSSPLKMVQTGNDPFTHTYSSSSGTWKLCPASAGQRWTVSVWVKASQTIQIEGCWIAEQDSSGNYLAGGGSPYPTIGTEWVRISASYTLVNASTAFVGIRLDGTQTGGAGVTVWWDGLQLELSSTATTFNPKTNTNRQNWWDIIGNNNLTLYGYPAYNSIGYFTLASSTANYMMNSSYPFPTNDHTIECWFRSTFAQPNQTPYTYSVAGDNHFLLFTNSTTQIAPHTFGAATPINVPNMQNVWCCVTRTRDKLSGTEYYYFNGIQVGSVVVAAGTAATTNGYLIVGQEADAPGGGFDANQNLDGDISRLTIYNRALTASEVLQNFNASRSRFGI